MLRIITINAFIKVIVFYFFYSRAERRIGNTVFSNPFENSGSAWIGLGEYFKNDFSSYSESAINDIDFDSTTGNIEGKDRDSDRYGSYEDSKDYEEINDASEDLRFETVPKRMKHASLDADITIISSRKDDEPMRNSPNNRRFLKRGKVIRSNMYFGEVPRDIMKKIKRKKKPKQAEKSKISGYIKNRIGRTEPVEFGMPTFNIGSKTDSLTTMRFYNLIERIGQELGRDVSGGYGLVGSRTAYDGKPGIVFIPSGTFTVRSKGGNRRSQSEQIIPVAVPQAVSVPVPQPIPVRILQPVAVAIPVPVPVERTVTVPVEKKVPVPVEKPVLVQIVKRVHVPVIKPYPVPVPVYKTQYIIHSQNETRSKIN